MGIRIHKVLGYGLTDVASSPYRMSSIDRDKSHHDLLRDSRFDPTGYFVTDIINAENQFKVDQFRVQLELICANSDVSILTLFKHQLNENPSSDIFNIMTYDPEFGDPSVVLFTPPFHPDWERYDDIIDYTEAKGVPLNNVQVLDTPIYPYVRWMDLRNPKEHPDKVLVDAATTFKFNPKFRDKINVEEIKKRFGFNSIDDMLENIVPVVPEEIVELTRYLKVFKDPNTVYQLKPMIYTYWS